MGPIAKRTLFAIMVVVFLLTACASAPVATQDPEFVQIEQTVDALAAAQNEPPVEQQAPVATPTASPVALQQPSGDPVLAEQNAQDAPTLDPTSVALQQTIDALASEQNAESARLAEQAAQATGTAEQLAAEAASSPTSETFRLFATPTQGPLPECKITFLRRNSRPETFRFPARQPLVGLGRGSGIIILQPVNLRTGPTLTNRILLTLRPDPSTTLIDPTNPTPTVTPRPEIIYKIIGGPVYTTIGDETGDNIRFSISGRVYKWWQIELPNKTTGWIVEASACGQIPFIAQANLVQTTP